MASPVGLRVVVVLAAAIGAFAAVTGGCSDDGPAASGDAGAEAAAPDGSRGRDAGSGDEDAGSCSSDCDEAHPAGLVKDRAILECWQASCKTPCIDQRDTPDAGDGGDAGPLACGSTPIVTVNATCDLCTKGSCCTPWAACFEDPDCKALNECYQRCPQP